MAIREMGPNKLFLLLIGFFIFSGSFTSQPSIFHNSYELANALDEEVYENEFHGCVQFGDHEYYYFPASAGQTVTIDIEGFTWTMIDVTVYLENDRVGGTDVLSEEEKQIQFIAIATGTYKIDVHGKCLAPYGGSHFDIGISISPRRDEPRNDIGLIISGISARDRYTDILKFIGEIIWN